jgi:hypothetical protein
LLFIYSPATVDFLDQAEQTLDFEADMEASPEAVYDVMAKTISAQIWVKYLCCVDRFTDPDDPEAVFDETFWFMTLRIRTIVAARGERWAASVDAGSLPLAVRMLEVVDLTPLEGGRTHFRWRICFDLPWYLKPFFPLVKPFFDHLFSASTRQLASFMTTYQP